MLLSLEGRVAMVCGSTQGIGLGIATAFATAGAKIILSARSEAKMQKVIADLPGSGHHHIVLDQEDPKNIAAAASQLRTMPIDILVNNTGGPDPGLVSEEKWENFDRAITKQLRCSQELTLAAIPNMRAGQFGRIINIISTSVKIPIPGLGVSNTVRGAVASWAKTLSMEVAPWGITVNNILPGFIHTQRLSQIARNNAKRDQMTEDQVLKVMADSVPTKAIGKVSDIAALAVFLSSSYASYINGTSIPVDGGRTGSI